MKQFRAHQDVSEGIYFDPRRLHFESLREEGVLPGERGQLYYRVPALVLLLAAPLFGLAYVVFLPLVGFVMVGGFLWERVSFAPLRRAWAKLRLHRQRSTVRGIRL